MNETASIPRSPLLMSREDTALLVVDMQTVLLNLIPGHQRLVWNITRLIDGARLFEMNVAGTEQYPKGLGGSDPQLAERLPNMPSKVKFSCTACAEIFADFSSKGVRKILVVGIETHVCVLQTVHDLIAHQFDVYVAADAVGARHQLDHDIGLRRMELAGATLTTTESALFEWCEQSGTPQFKEISKLVQQTPPLD